MKATKEGVLEIIEELNQEFKEREKWFDRDTMIVFQELRAKLWELKKGIQDGTSEYF